MIVGDEKGCYSVPNETSYNDVFSSYRQGLFTRNFVVNQAETCPSDKNVHQNFSHHSKTFSPPLPVGII